MPDKKNQLILILLESKEQYELFLNSKVNLKDNKYIICPMTISAYVFCKDSKLNFVLVDDYYSEKEHKFYKDKSEKVIKNLVSSLNEYYSTIKRVDSFKFDMGNYHYFFLYHFFDSLHNRAFLINKLIDGINPDRIIVFKSYNLSKNQRPFPISQYTNCYYDLLSNSVFNDRVLVVAIENFVHPAAKNFNLRSFVGKIIRRVPLIDSYLNIKQTGIKVSFIRRIFITFNPSILLIGGPGHWKDFFNKSIVRNNVSFYFGYNEIDPYKVKPINWFNQWFSWSNNFCGFDIAALGLYEMDRVRLLSDEIINIHNKQIEIVKNKKLLIYAVCPHPFQQYTLSLAKHLNIPRVCYQHGAMSMHDPGLFDEASELIYASHYFSYSDMVSIDKSNEAKKIDGFEKAIPVGSMVLENLLASINNINYSKDYILYVSSKFVSNSAGFLPKYIDIHVYENQQNLLTYFSSLIKENPNIEFVWKLSPEMMSEQAEIYLKDKNIKVFYEQPTFSQLLPNAKMVILDRPSTTSIEACMTDKPLFILLEKNYFYPNVEAMLKKRAVVKHTPEKLLEAIKEYISDDIYPADINNRDFVEGYGLINDGSDTNSRINNALESIINETV